MKGTFSTRKTTCTWCGGWGTTIAIGIFTAALLLAAANLEGKRLAKDPPPDTGPPPEVEVGDWSITNVDRGLFLSPTWKQAR